MTNINSELHKLPDQELLSFIENEYRFGAPEVVCALIKEFELNQDQVDEIEESGDHEYLNVDGCDYLAGTDDEMDILWDEDLDNYLEECIYPELPNNMRFYFDDETWKEDARFDGRAHSLARYDGNEHKINFNGEDYYFYRTN